ncbi:hypothetical protein [Methylocystis sp. SC2]|uniref:hypothetical protein n=1 Tax=Methylocystis sp. (strain SC2) TaxID=187303 RepID=UPI00027AF012|nr:hypothetical protein [Methylocystis sp. SC2]CCJ07058.1 Hypothetical protein BN69_1607 [Methylocystis sp. SC2]
MAASMLVFEGEGGELASYLGVDFSEAAPSRESEELIRVYYDSFDQDAGPLPPKVVDFLTHLGFPLVEGGDHCIVANLFNALIVLAPKPGDGDRP